MDTGEDLENGGAEESIDQILRELPCLFLLNKNDKKEFKGQENIEEILGLHEINCIDTKCLAASALDLNGVERAIDWVYKAVIENSKL